MHSIFSMNHQCIKCPRTNKYDIERISELKTANCISDRTWCMTVNRIDMKTGNSVAVYKRCAEKEECDIDHIGCYESAIPGVLVRVLFLSYYS